MNNKSSPGNKRIIIYRTHFWDDACAREVDKLRNSLLDHDVVVVGVTDEEVNVPSDVQAHFYTSEDVRQLDYPLQQSLEPSHCYPMKYFRQFPDYEQYWLIEYDVRYVGDWADFIRGLDSSPADLLGTVIQTKPENPEWYHWPSLITGQENIPDSSRVKVFTPLMRLSKNAMSAVDMAYSAGWSGHYEALWATAVAAAGLVIEEFGGDGAYTPANRKGRYYTNARLDRHLSPGTFVFRPSMLEEDIPDWPDTLWHPIKSAAMSKLLPTPATPS
jgi:hypothetical protein